MENQESTWRSHLLQKFGQHWTMGSAGRKPPEQQTFGKKTAEAKTSWILKKLFKTVLQYWHWMTAYHIITSQHNIKYVISYQYHISYKISHHQNHHILSLNDTNTVYLPTVYCDAWQCFQQCLLNTRHTAQHEWVNEWVRRVLRPAWHITGHYEDESLQAITCTRTDNKNQQQNMKITAQKIEITITKLPTHTNMILTTKYSPTHKWLKRPKKIQHKNLV